MDTKKCSHCGVEQPLENFRKYYDAKGHYTFCRSCERIESRRKYLMRKSSLTEEQQAELNKINELYKLRVAAGLSAPGMRTTTTVSDMVDAQLSKYQ